MANKTIPVRYRVPIEHQNSEEWKHLRTIEIESNLTFDENDLSVGGDIINNVTNNISNKYGMLSVNSTSALMNIDTSVNFDVVHVKSFHNLRVRGIQKEYGGGLFVLTEKLKNPFQTALENVLFFQSSQSDKVWVRIIENECISIEAFGALSLPDIETTNAYDLYQFFTLFHISNVNKIVFETRHYLCNALSVIDLQEFKEYDFQNSTIEFWGLNLFSSNPCFHIKQGSILKNLYLRLGYYDTSFSQNGFCIEVGTSFTDYFCNIENVNTIDNFTNFINLYQSQLNVSNCKINVYTLQFNPILPNSQTVQGKVFDSVASVIKINNCVISASGDSKPFVLTNTDIAIFESSITSESIVFTDIFNESFPERENLRFLNGVKINNENSAFSTTIEIGNVIKPKNFFYDLSECVLKVGYFGENVNFNLCDVYGFEANFGSYFLKECRIKNCDFNLCQSIVLDNCDFYKLTHSINVIECYSFVLKNSHFDEKNKFPNLFIRDTKNSKVSNNLIKLDSGEGYINVNSIIANVPDYSNFCNFEFSENYVDAKFLQNVAVENKNFISCEGATISSFLSNTFTVFSDSTLIDDDRYFILCKSKCVFNNNKVNIYESYAYVFFRVFTENNFFNDCTVLDFSKNVISVKLDNYNGTPYNTKPLINCYSNYKRFAAFRNNEFSYNEDLGVYPFIIDSSVFINVFEGNLSIQKNVFEFSDCIVISMFGTTDYVKLHELNYPTFVKDNLSL